VTTPAPPPAPLRRPDEKRRRWRRRVLRWLAVLVALRLLLALALTPLLQWALGASGLDAHLGASRLLLLAGRLELRDLSLRVPGEDPAAPLRSGLVVRSLLADIDLSALLRGKLRIESLLVDEAQLALERDADGCWPLLEALAGQPAPPEPPDGEPGALSLAWPVEVEELALNPLRLRMTDAAADVPDVTALELTLRVDDLVAGETGRLELRCNGTGLDQLGLDAELRADTRELSATLRGRVAGLVPAALGPLLRVAGLGGQAHDVGGRFEVQVAATVQDPVARTLSGVVRVRDVSITEDRAATLVLESLEVPLDELGPASIRLGQVTLQGVRAQLSRRDDGALAVAGLDVLPGPPSGTEPAPAAPDEPAGARRFALGGVDVHGVVVTWFDSRGRMEIAVEQLVLAPLDSAAPGPVALSLVLREPDLLQRPLGAEPLPPLFERLALEGSITPFGTRPSAELALTTEGLSAVALDPWLAAAGWATDLRAATLSTRMSAAFDRQASGLLRGALELRDLVLADGGERLRLAAVELKDIELPPDGGVHVGLLHVAGPVLAVQRDAGGTLHVPGLRSVPVKARAAAEPPDPPPVAGPSAPPPPLALVRFTWDGAALAVLDESVSPPVELTITPRAQAEGLRFGGAQGSAGKASLSVTAPGAWEGLDAQIELRALDDPRDLGATLGLSLNDLHAGALAGWLSASGLDGAGLHASLQVSADLQVHGGDVPRTDLVLSDLAWTDGGAAQLLLPRLALQGLRAEGGATRLDRVELAPADVHLRRDADGVLAFGGLRFVGRPAAAESAAPAPVVAPADEAPPAPAPFRLGSLAMPRFTVHWSDAAVTPAVELPVDVTVQVDELVAGAEAEPGRVALAVHAPTVCEPLSLSGTLALPPGGLHARLGLAAAGVTLAALRPYLGPDVEPALVDGRFSAQLALESGQAEAGGVQLDARLGALDWRDAGAAEPLLALESLRFVMPRFDTAAGVLQVDEVSGAGLALAAERRAGGTLAALGLLLHPATAVAAEPPPAAPDAPAHGSHRAALPVKDFRIERVDLALGPLRLLDSSGEQPGVPLVLQARLAAPEPLVVLDRTLEDAPPVRLELRGSAEPVARSLAVDLYLDPSEARPAVQADLAVEGLRGAGLTEVQPALAAALDGSGLADGTLAAHLDAQLSWPRRSPLDFDFSGGLAGHIALADVALRAVPEGEPLLGLKRLEVDLVDVRPHSGAVHLSNVDADGLLARLGVAADGVTVGGLRFIPAPAPPVVEGEPEAAPAEPTPPPPAPAGPPLRIDTLMVNGLDLLVRDETSTPPMILPVRDLDLEVRGLSRGVKPVPSLRFAATVRGGDVQLPVRQHASSLLAGMVGAAARAVSGESDVDVLEPRPVFDEISLQGRVEPGPYPRGWLNLSVSALELQAFAGPAKRSGVLIDDGTLQAELRSRLAGEEGSHSDLRLTFDYLSLSEPSNGPISRWLRLPAPLDTVLFLLKNEDGEHVIAVTFEAPPNSLGTGRLASAATGALSSVIARAVASSPLRVLGTVTELVGVTGGRTEELGEPPLELDFSPGDPLPAADASARLLPLAQRMADDDDLIVVIEHAFGGGDAERALVLSNPPRADALALVERLRLQRDERRRVRDQLAAEARALFAVGHGDEAAQFTARVLDQDRTLGDLEASLDRTLALLDTDAPRRAPQRARATAVEFGEARVAHVRSMLLAAGGEELLGRIELKPVRFVPAADEAGGRVLLTVKSRPTGGFLDWLFGWIPGLFASSGEDATGGA